MIRNIIFDWSGTLVNDLPAVWEATNYVLTQGERAQMSLEQFRAEFCLPFSIFYERHLPHVSISQLETWFHSRFRQVQHSVCELPHAREFLEFCKARKLRAFVLSTIHREHFAAQVKNNGFDQFLERPYTEIWDKRTKIQELLEENQLNPAETLFVGDMQHDIETARHGGVYSCAVLTGYNTLEQLRGANPDLIVEHLQELKEILEENNLEVRSHGKRFEQAHFPIATVGALIFNKLNQVLMVRTHKWSNLWGIPGGKIKWGETCIDALRREIKEETNLDIDEICFVLAQDSIHSKDFYRDAHFILLNYTCRCREESEVKLNEEASAFRWVTISEALEMPINLPTRKLLLTELKKGPGKT